MRPRPCARPPPCRFPPRASGPGGATRPSRHRGRIRAFYRARGAISSRRKIGLDPGVGVQLANLVKLAHAVPFVGTESPRRRAMESPGSAASSTAPWRSIRNGPGDGSRPSPRWGRSSRRGPGLGGYSGNAPLAANCPAEHQAAVSARRWAGLARCANQRSAKAVSRGNAGILTKASISTGCRQGVTGPWPPPARPVVSRLVGEPPALHSRAEALGFAPAARCGD